ncbi:hypothetical protein JZ751_025196, partial [Albula glossodonta]
MPIQRSLCVAYNLASGMRHGFESSLMASPMMATGVPGHPVSMETPPSDTDPLILSLCLIISIIIMLLSVSVLLSRGRFLLKKIWPLIPSPENKFPGLFTLYAGDFQAWLVHSSGGLGWRPEIFYLEELPALLEVLSEASLGPAIPARILPPRALYAAGAEGEDELEEVRKTHADLLDSRKEEPQEPCLLDQLSPLPQDPLSPLERTPLESKDAYVTLNPGPQHDSSQFPLDDVSEESLPLQVLFASPETPGSHSDLGSLRQTSGSGRLSSQSSFESSHSSWHPKSTGYAYLTIADSVIVEASKSDREPCWLHDKPICDTNRRTWEKEGSEITVD